MKYGLIVVGVVGVMAWVQAADISPSRTVVPDSFRNPPGKRFSIFSGDPERVQKANEVNVKDLHATVKIEPVEISLSQPDAQLVCQMVVQNKGSRNYTLSFPDAQRFDLAIVTADDQLLYLWSEDKIFVQATGMSFLNAGEMIEFKQGLPVELIREKCRPGKYKVAMILSNYPEVKAAAEFIVHP
ncbi:MAG: BsuPI-related putative proteinase inhibitor [Candidatus Methylacidiphilales bacterium]